MYIVAKEFKTDPTKRWNLPDRVFFACGACHILAYAFMQKFPKSGFQPIWIKPAKGFTGNHIVAVKEDIAFDYHGYSSWQKLTRHIEEKANRWWPSWHAEYISLAIDVLISERKSRAIDGLWLREPKQFLHNPYPALRNSSRNYRNHDEYSFFGSDLIFRFAFVLNARICRRHA